MEMPNTVPNALTQALLADKYEIAARTSMANYSFFMGASNNNLAEVLRTDPRSVCGIKVFMGSSTGSMLVDDVHVLNELFRESPMLIATHCEDEATVRANSEYYRAQYGDRPLPTYTRWYVMKRPVSCHPRWPSTWPGDTTPVCMSCTSLLPTNWPCSETTARWLTNVLRRRFAYITFGSTVRIMRVWAIRSSATRP
jgi:hypothetical protein